MAGDREKIFLDTAFVQALLNRRDEYHDGARRLFPRVVAATEVVVTEAVLVEVGNALSGLARTAAAQFIRSCYDSPNITIIPVDPELFQRALDLFSERSDKEWGLTDCISFVVMRERKLQLAATRDHHFEQAGFTPLL
jgi:uncharacterized protein